MQRITRIAREVGAVKGSITIKGIAKAAAGSNTNATAEAVITEIMKSGHPRVIKEHIAVIAIKGNVAKIGSQHQGDQREEGTMTEEQEGTTMIMKGAVEGTVEEEWEGTVIEGNKGIDGTQKST